MVIKGYYVDIEYPEIFSADYYLYSIYVQLAPIKIKRLSFNIFIL